LLDNNRWACIFRVARLIGANEWRMNDIDYEAMSSRAGLESVAKYADSIGPPLSELIEPGPGGTVQPSQLLLDARELGLAVHPFTFRREGLPEGRSLESLLDLFMHDLQVEGLVTDHPDVALKRRDRP
jgi:glycerophosphoryl diester phosphodiesterase